MKTTAVIIARFQTPHFHEGHRQLIEQVRAAHHKVVIVLGVSPVKLSRRNPFDFYTRERMLKKAYPELFVLPLQDHPSDARWSENLDQLLQATCSNETFLLYGSRDSFIPYYSGRNRVEELEAAGNYSATALRAFYADKVMDSEDFRLGINYACNNRYTQVYMAVDIVLFRNNRQEVLLGQKHGSEALRLPGGFVDPSDASLEIAAKRELTEECGSMETGSMHYLGSSLVNDWRYESEDDKIMTSVFAADLIFGTAKAGDDLRAVAWYPLADLPGMIQSGLLAKEHIPLIESFILHKQHSITLEKN